MEEASRPPQVRHGHRICVVPPGGVIALGQGWPVIAAAVGEEPPGGAGIGQARFPQGVAANYRSLALPHFWCKRSSARGTRGKTPGRRMPLIRLDESALQILDNLALNTARQRSSSNHKRSLKPRDCHVAIGYWATRRNTWRHPQVASTAALQKRRSIKDLPLPGVLPLVPFGLLSC